MLDIVYIILTNNSSYNSIINQIEVIMFINAYTQLQRLKYKILYKNRGLFNSYEESEINDDFENIRNNIAELKNRVRKYKSIVENQDIIIKSYKKDIHDYQEYIEKIDNFLIKNNLKIDDIC